MNNNAQSAAYSERIERHLVIASMPVSQKTIDLLNRCVENSGAIAAMIASGVLPGAAPQDPPPALEAPTKP
jgi:hypothetical protein